LDGLGIHPGAELEVLARNYDETMSLRIGGRAAQLGPAAAGRVWVEKVA
jgi:Fe2+ transport system protein FeoA